MNHLLDWPTLFVGAFLDALIGPNLLVPGEPFLLAAGYQLQQGIYAGVIAVFIAGWLGDQSSYFIGRQFGVPAQRKLTAWQPWLNRYFARARLLMRQSGNHILLFSRLLGPIAWIVPFIAGTQQVAWQRFTFFSGIGLMLGVGQFVLWGYLLAYGIEAIPWLHTAKVYLTEHKTGVIIGVVVFIGAFVALQLRRRQVVAKLSEEDDSTLK